MLYFILEFILYEQCIKLYIYDCILGLVHFLYEQCYINRILFLVHFLYEQFHVFLGKPYKSSPNIVCKSLRS